LISIEAAVRIRLQFFLLGLLVGWWLARQSASRVEQPEKQRPAAAPETAPREEPASIPVEPARTGAVSREPDPLTEIKGIGRTFEHALRVAGITTFSQLAALDSDALAEKLGGRVTGERIRRENWIAQARERARATQ
jgi:large subunit ribosomal protein L21